MVSSFIQNLLHNNLMAIDDIDALRQLAIAVDTTTREIEDALSVHVIVSVIV